MSQFVGGDGRHRVDGVGALHHGEPVLKDRKRGSRSQSPPRSPTCHRRAPRRPRPGRPGCWCPEIGWSETHLQATDDRSSSTWRRRSRLRRRWPPRRTRRWPRPAAARAWCSISPRVRWSLGRTFQRDRYGTTCTGRWVDATGSAIAPSQRTSPPPCHGYPRAALRLSDPTARSPSAPGLERTPGHAHWSRARTWCQSCLSRPSAHPPPLVVPTSTTKDGTRASGVADHRKS